MNQNLSIIHSLRIVVLKISNYDNYQYQEIINIQLAMNVFQNHSKLLIFYGQIIITI